MNTYYSADYILPMDSEKIKDGVVAIDEHGVVQGLYCSDDEKLANEKIVRHRGILLPGFVNAHCHLELSHMKGRVPVGTGLPDFLSTVMSQRGAKDELVLEAMKTADKAMYDQGIQAVGDHVNTGLSALTKRQSTIYYHTFVEVLGMSEQGIEERISHANKLASQYSPLSSSITPHAPYSCSEKFFYVFGHSIDRTNTLSIHNQESDEENHLFDSKGGRFIDFYERNNIPYAHFEAQGKRSLQAYVPWLPKDNNLILVHNTFTSAEDLSFMKNINREASYCLCPKANLYIEGQLPPVREIVASGYNIVIGTDSFASNDTLSILDELVVLQRAFPDLSTEQMLRWATINGANALGMGHVLGSLAVGKAPGLILLEGMDGWNFTEMTIVHRIV